jgi:DNA repair protein RecN (Recombination protein N)
MIKRLTITNYALIDSLDIEFSRGLNTITGETGAGKSLLLGALSVILGGKADANVLRDKAKACVIEAEFDIAGFSLESIFESLDLDVAETVILRRVINPAGKSRAFAGELPVSVSVLKEIGGRLVDIHSQHQTLLVSNPKFQIDLIDSVAGEAALLDRYTETYDRWRASSREWEQLRASAAQGLRDEEYLRFQAQQLAEARLREGEQAELEAAANELTHAAEIRQALLDAEALLSGEQNGVLASLKAAQNGLSRIAPVFPRGGALEERLRAAREELKDIASELAAEGERVEVDPQKLELTERRLDLLNSLMQKHRSRTVEELIELHREIAEKLSGIEHADEAIERLAGQTERLHGEARQLAARLGEVRRGAVPAIERQVVALSAQLGMPNVQFRVDISPADELTPTGGERIAFLFTANRNMPPQPVERIASGGEMSRLMLSLKSITAQHRQLPTIIFDEIDTGVSGEIADRMGRIIDELSRRLQVINITHLPQVASKGGSHFKVYKEDTPTATHTGIRRLSAPERVEEIARMLSGAELTEAAVVQAKTLLNG